MEEKVFILVLLDHGVDVDVDKQNLELFHNIDTTFIAFLVKKKHIKYVRHSFGRKTILVLLDHVVDVDVDEQDLDPFHNIDTTFIAFLVKKST